MCTVNEDPPVQVVTVEWRHLEQGGRTCARCTATGQGLTTLMERLQEECRPRGVEIHFIETKLPAKAIDQSNLILINGSPLEVLLPMAAATTSPCCSCGEITGQTESCRAIVWQGQTHEAIPPELIREAICRLAKCCSGGRSR